MNEFHFDTTKNTNVFYCIAPYVVAFDGSRISVKNRERHVIFQAEPPKDFNFESFAREFADAPFKEGDTTAYLYDEATDPMIGLCHGLVECWDIYVGRVLSLLVAMKDIPMLPIDQWMVDIEDRLRVILSVYASICNAAETMKKHTAKNVRNTFVPQLHGDIEIESDARLVAIIAKQQETIAQQAAIIEKILNNH